MNYINIDKTVSETLKKLKDKQTRDKLKRQNQLAKLNS